MIMKTRLNYPIVKHLLTISMLFGMFQTHAHAWEEDFYVFVSNSNESLPAGSISHGFNDAPLLPSHDDACGVLIEDVENLSWYFYEYNSSPAIQSINNVGDVIVFLPLPGCGNNGTARINIDGQDILPPGGAADYALLSDGSSFRSVDQQGNVIPPSGGGHVNHVPTTDLTDEQDDHGWEMINPNLLLAKRELLRGDPQSRLGPLLASLEKFSTDRRKEIYPSRSLTSSSLTRTRSGGVNEKHNLKVTDHHLDALVDNLKRCIQHYYAGNLDTAYIACDQALQNSDRVVSMRQLLKE